MSGKDTGIAVEKGDQTALQRFEGHRDEVASVGHKYKAQIKRPRKETKRPREDKTELGESEKLWKSCDITKTYIIQTTVSVKRS